MLEQQNNSVIFYAYYALLSTMAGATGLTVTVDVWEIQRDGTATEIVTGGSATEIGDGLYRYLLAAGSVDEPAEYIAVFKTAATTVVQKDIPALWVIERAGIENLDEAVSTGPLDTALESTHTLAEALRVMLAALAGLSAGGGTTTITFQDVADSKARITATVDANGNRSSILLDGS